MVEWDTKVNLALCKADYCASIARAYEPNAVFGGSTIMLCYDEIGEVMLLYRIKAHKRT